MLQLHLNVVVYNYKTRMAAFEGMHVVAKQSDVRLLRKFDYRTKTQRQTDMQHTVIGPLHYV